MIHVRLAPYPGTLDALARADLAFDTANQVRLATETDGNRERNPIMTEVEGATAFRNSNLPAKMSFLRLDTAETVRPSRLDFVTLSNRSGSGIELRLPHIPVI